MIPVPVMDNVCYFLHSSVRFGSRPWPEPILSQLQRAWTCVSVEQGGAESTKQQRAELDPPPLLIHPVCSESRRHRV